MHFTDEEYCTKITLGLQQWLRKPDNPGLTRACNQAASEYISSKLGSQSRSTEARTLIRNISPDNAGTQFWNTIVTGNWKTEGHTATLLGYSFGCASLNTLLMYHAIRTYMNEMHSTLLSARETHDNRQDINNDTLKLYEDTNALNQTPRHLQARCEQIYRALAQRSLFATPNDSEKKTARRVKR